MAAAATTTSTSALIDSYNSSLGYHSSVIPLDVRLKNNLPEKEQHQQRQQQQDIKPLRWGILATGKVAHDFSQALKFLSSRRHVITAVGSRTLSRAQEFSKRHKISKAYGSYQDLCADAEVDIVYVASIHPCHFEHAKMALDNGKHVLVEKPMAMKSSDAETLYSMGQRLNRFVGEGLWTRFFPAVEWARMRLGGGGDNGEEREEGGIGNVRALHADFSIDGNDVGPYPTDSIYDKRQGGGASWTLAPYVVSAAMMPFGREPDTVLATGILPNEEDDDIAGNFAVGMTLLFDQTKSSNKEGGDLEKKKTYRSRKNTALASVYVGFLAETCEETLYAGKGGRIRILGPAHCPTSAVLTRKQAGRGNGQTTTTTASASENSGGDSTDAVAADNTNSGVTVVEFPLPPATREIEESGGFLMPNSMGFIYEAEAVRRIISTAEEQPFSCLTFPQWTPEESIGCIRVLESCLEQAVANGTRF